MKIMEIILGFLLLILHVRVVFCACGHPYVYSSVKTFRPDCRYRCNCRNNASCDSMTGACQNGCLRGWMGPACQYRNLATTVMQSEQWPQSVSGIDASSMAIDGDITTCSRTGLGNGRRWLRIDLASQVYITGLVITIPAADVNQFRGFTVEIGNSTAQETFSRCYSHGNTDAQVVMEINCVEPMVGQYLRINLTEMETRNLSLCEVDIYGGRLVSFNQQTSMQSNYADTDGTPWYSSYAVDGKTNSGGANQGVKSQRTCASTNSTGSTTANHSWLVDLSTEFGIQAVSFFGRSDSTNLVNQYRGFSLKSSKDNISFTEIFKDDTTQDNNPYLYQPKSRNLTWPINSRFVRVDRTVYILVVCEVEIFGDCPLGLCGWDCTETCNCSNQTTGTHKINGTCPHGCAGRWTGVGGKCNFECNNSYWGPTCSQECGHCTGPCNVVDGICPGSCEPGWQPPNCTRECTSGKYGIDCNDMCGSCKVGTNCNKVDGRCYGGCAPGYKEPYCTTECDADTYGDNCTKACGNCTNSDACNRVNGSCPQGCAAGYQGNTCHSQCSPQWYGLNCSDSCGSCKYGVSCDHVTGLCPSGLCESGFETDFCNKTCDKGLFGDRCENACGFCLNNASCSYKNGSCPVGCSEGFTGPICMTPCDPGKYGPNCSKICGPCDKETNCNRMTGKCFNGCLPGWKGLFCEMPCDAGYYGKDCNETCGNCKGDKSCNAEDGTCEACIAGYKLKLCNDNEDPPSTPIAGIIGGAVGGAVATAVVAVLIVVILKRRSSSSPLKYTDTRTEFTNNHMSSTVENVERDDADQDTRVRISIQHGPAGEPVDYYNSVSTEHERPDMKLIEVSKLRLDCRKAIKDPTTVFIEFNEFPTGLIKSTSEARKSEHAGKNRYRDLYPYDENRVHLPEIPGNPASTYINASYITGYHRPKRYIAAQGAWKTTVDDIWRMIWSENIAVIAMLTGCFEEGKLKCVQYWPENGSTVYRDIQVDVVSVEQYTYFDVRTFHVTKGDSIKRTVVQFHFTAWPDKDVPDTALSIVQFWRKVRAYVPSDKAAAESPWLVHCSAGVGRTGTFIATDFLYDQGNAEGRVDIKVYLMELRKQRVKMVQTKEQYLLLHEILAEVLDPIGSVISKDDFTRQYPQLVSNTAKNKQKLYVEYQEICKASEEILEAQEEGGIYFNTGTAQGRDAHKTENMSKSRDPNIYPEDKDRPRLSTAVQGCSDFINAVYIPTYRYKDCLILTQYPLKTTAVDFIRMIWEYNITEIVLLENPAPEEGKYWPISNSKLVTGPFKVETVREKPKDTHLVRTLRIKMEGNKHQKEVNQYQFQQWQQGKNIPDNKTAILQLISEVEKNRSRSSDFHPLVVQCLDGATRSGVFCLIYSVLERIQLDRQVAVAETLRLARVKRRQLIDNFDQYKYCHDVIYEYLQNFDVYANVI